MRGSLLLMLCLACAGCAAGEPVIDTTTDATTDATMKAAAQSLPEAERKGFAAAATMLSLKAAFTAGPAAPRRELFRDLNGLTARQVIAQTQEKIRAQAKAAP